MSRNGRHRPSRPRIEISSVSAAPDEAAAIAAAIEQFLRDTAASPEAGLAERPNPWLRAGLLEGVGLDPTGAAPALWGQ